WRRLGIGAHASTGQKENRARSLGPRIGWGGDHILGPRIGSGSFAVVWRPRSGSSGAEVAVKEIDMKQVDSKVRDGLVKENHISHPDIARLSQAIETADKIFIVLDHCASDDLAADIQCHRIHGRVSMGVARHFMRQLGLKILGEINLIHRGGLLYLDCYLSFR
ncbi:unnamed protein product, partial [Musa acuminata var. zebrina]